MIKEHSFPRISPFEGILTTAIYMYNLDNTRAYKGEALGLEEVTAREGNYVFFRCGTAIVLVFEPSKTRKQTLDTGLSIPARGASHICLGMPGRLVEI